MRRYAIFLIGMKHTDTVYTRAMTPVDAIHAAVDELYSQDWVEIVVVRDPDFNMIHTGVRAEERR